MTDGRETDGLITDDREIILLADEGRTRLDRVSEWDSRLINNIRMYDFWYIVFGVFG